MIKSCMQIAEEIREVQRQLQQSRLTNLYFKVNNKKSLNNENTVDHKEENRDSSRTEA